MTAPAMPNAPQLGGKELRGRTVAGLALELLRMSMPMLGNSEDGQAVAEVVAKLGRKFAKPPQDLAQSELKFMQSQLNPMPRPQAMDMGPQAQGALAAQGVGGGGMTTPPAPAAAGGAPA